MKQNFTFNDLIRFVYNETSDLENNQLVDKLSNDDALFDQYEKLEDAKSYLSEVKIAPQSSSIESILRYSRETAFEAQM